VSSLEKLGGGGKRGKTDIMGNPGIGGGGDIQEGGGWMGTVSLLKCIDPKE